MMFGLGSFNLINEFERAFNEPNAEHLASSSARLQPYIYMSRRDNFPQNTKPSGMVSITCG